MATLASSRPTSGLHVAIAVYLVLGLAEALSLRALPRSGPPELVREIAGIEETLDPRRMNARELRRLPGIGRVRAEAIVLAREQHSGPGSLSWDDIRGIGPITRARVELWLQGRGVDSSLPLSEGPDGPPMDASD